jgi:hypothetical protein
MALQLIYIDIGYKQNCHQIKTYLGPLGYATNHKVDHIYCLNNQGSLNMTLRLFDKGKFKITVIPLTVTNAELALVPWVAQQLPGLILFITSITKDPRQVNSNKNSLH